MSKELRSIRALSKDSLRGVVAPKPGRLPKFEIVDPNTLYVEGDYQRELSARSVRLIRNIVGGFSWARFKPPICVRLPESGNILVLIDGQHTAIAIACHPDIDKLPVMVVEAADVAARAAAFVGHNRDRVALTQMAIFRAELASGDALAETVERACRTAGAQILDKAINLRNPTPPGHTIAVGTIRALAKRQGEDALVRVLKVLVAAGRGPIKADEIAATALILQAAGAVPGIDARLREAIAAKTAEQWAAIAAQRTAQSGESAPSATASIWCQQLNIRLSGPTMKGAGKHAAGRLIQGGAKMRPEPPQEAKEAPEKPASPPPRPIPRPEAKPVPVARPASAPPNSSAVPNPTTQLKPKAEVPINLGTPSAPTGHLVTWNGVMLDLRSRRVTHRGREDKLTDDGIRLVGTLARVMPSFLPPETLAKKVFGKAADDFQVRGLIAAANQTLAGLRLQVKEVPKMGWMLADLGE